jgi:predicted kinase
MADKMPTLYFLIGLPASGKSTWRKSHYGIVLSTDDYIHQYAKDTNSTYSECFKDAVKLAETQMYEDLNQAIESGADIIWDQTNVSKKVRKNKLAKIPEHYWKVAVYFTCPEQEEWQRRLDARPEQQISKKILDDMAGRMEFPTKAEGFDQVIVVENNQEVVYN